jgi:hypothetical protein
MFLETSGSLRVTWQYNPEYCNRNQIHLLYISAGVGTATAHAAILCLSSLLNQSVDNEFVKQWRMIHLPPKRVWSILLSDIAVDVTLKHIRLVQFHHFSRQYNTA